MSEEPIEPSYIELEDCKVVITLNVRTQQEAIHLYNALVAQSATGFVTINAANAWTAFYLRTDHGTTACQNLSGRTG